MGSRRCTVSSSFFPRRSQLTVLTGPSPLAPPVPLQMSDSDLSRIANEIARDIYPLDDVLRQFKIDAYFFRENILPHPRFRALYSEAYTAWHSANNSNERSVLKAGVLFEQWLEEANRLFHEQSQPLSSKVDMMKIVARVAGLDKDKVQQGVAPGDRVVVNINLSAAGRQEPIVIDKTAASVTYDQVLPPQAT